MKKAALCALTSALVLASMLPPLSPTARAQEKKPAEASKSAPKLKVGDMAPDFTLKYFDGSDVKDVSLKDFKGKKNVVLAFYVFAFTPG